MNNNDKFNLRQKLDEILIKPDNISNINETLGETNPKNKIFNEDEDYVSNLLIELDKPFFNIMKKNKDNIQKRNAIRRSSNIKSTSEDKDEIRHINIIYNCLIRIGGFMDFCKFNKIDEETIRSCTPYLYVEKYNAGEYIFRKNAQSDHFYCILRGKVSIRIPNMNNKYKDVKLENIQENQELLKEFTDFQRANPIFGNEGIVNIEKILNSMKKDNAEIEKLVLQEGKCFGEWGIIYNEKRSASAYTLEETYLMILPKQIFIDCFSSSVLKAENERRKFLKQKIPSFYQNHTATHYFKRISIECPKRNQIMYIENSKGDEFYLIFEGEFLLDNKYSKKNINESNDEDDYNIDAPKSRNISNNYSNKMIYPKILTKGSFAGLEAIINLDSAYECTLKAQNNFNVIFKIRPNDFPEFKENIINDLRKISVKMKEEPNLKTCTNNGKNSAYVNKNTENVEKNVVFKKLKRRDPNKLLSEIVNKFDSPRQPYKTYDENLKIPSEYKLKSSEDKYSIYYSSEKTNKGPNNGFSNKPCNDEKINFEQNKNNLLNTPKSLAKKETKIETPDIKRLSLLNSRINNNENNNNISEFQPFQNQLKRNTIIRDFSNFSKYKKFSLFSNVESLEFLKRINIKPEDNNINSEENKNKSIVNNNEISNNINNEKSIVNSGFVTEAGGNKFKRLSIDIMNPAKNHNLKKILNNYLSQEKEKQINLYRRVSKSEKHEKGAMISFDWKSYNKVNTFKINFFNSHDELEKTKVANLAKEQPFSPKNFNQRISILQNVKIKPISENNQKKDSREKNNNYEPKKGSSPKSIHPDNIKEPIDKVSTEPAEPKNTRKIENKKRDSLFNSKINSRGIISKKISIMPNNSIHASSNLILNRINIMKNRLMNEKFMINPISLIKISDENNRNIVISDK